MNKLEKLNILAEKIGQCQKCKDLLESTIKPAPGEGNPDAKLVICGEAEGKNETEQGRPFVGRAGQLLTNMLLACGLDREKDVFILNILKCRPPQNRAPLAEEAANCRPFLDLQLKIINPTHILCLGTSAANFLLGYNLPIGQMRGHWHQYNNARVLASYHPAYLLRNPAAKADVAEDLKILLASLQTASSEV